MTEIPQAQSQRINTPRMGEPKESQLSLMNHKILLHRMEDCALQGTMEACMPLIGLGLQLP